MPVAMISTSTSPAFGPSRSSSTISSGCLASKATAARVFMVVSSLLCASPCHLPRPSAKQGMKGEACRRTIGLQGRHALITGGGTGIGAATADASRMRPARRSRCSAAGSSRSKRSPRDRRRHGHRLRRHRPRRDRPRLRRGPRRQRPDRLSSSSTPASATARPFGRTTREAWDRIIATNLTLCFDCAQLALPDLLGGEDSRLVFVASVAGPQGRALCRALCRLQAWRGRPDAQPGAGVRQDRP